MLHDGAVAPPWHRHGVASGAHGGTMTLPWHTMARHGTLWHTIGTAVVRHKNHKMYMPPFETPGEFRDRVRHAMARYGTPEGLP